MYLTVSVVVLTSTLYSSIHTVYYGGAMGSRGRQLSKIMYWWTLLRTKNKKVIQIVLLSYLKSNKPVPNVNATTVEGKVLTYINMVLCSELKGFSRDVFSAPLGSSALIFSYNRFSLHWDVIESIKAAWS